MSREGRDNLGLGGAKPIVTMLRQVVRVAMAGDDVAEDAEAGDARDVADHRGSWTFICTNAFCMRWTWVPALSINVARWRRYPRRATLASAGRKLPRRSPRMCRSGSHSQSDTSLLRPGRFLT